MPKLDSKTLAGVAAMAGGIVIFLWGFKAVF